MRLELLTCGVCSLVAVVAALQSWSNPYDLGLRRNLHATLGASRWLVGVLCPQPFGVARLEGDGTRFQLNPRLAQQQADDVDAQHDFEGVTLI